MAELGGKTGTFDIATLSWYLEVVEALSDAALAIRSACVVGDQASAEAVIARLSVSGNNTIVSSGA